MAGKRVTEGKIPTVIRDRCGTTAGYHAHVYRSELVCDPCRNALNTHQRAYANENKDRIYSAHNERQRKRYAEDEEYREKLGLWNKENPERRREIVNAWADKNREYLRTYDAEYRAKHPEKMREKSRRRRARKYANGFEPYTEQQVLDTYGTDCHICNEPIDLDAPRRTSQKGWEKGLHIDHLIPIAKGGSDTLENTRPAHGLCNISRGASMPEVENGIREAAEKGRQSDEGIPRR